MATDADFDDAISRVSRIITEITPARGSLGVSMQGTGKVEMTNVGIFGFDRGADFQNTGDVKMNQTMIDSGQREEISEKLRTIVLILREMKDGKVEENRGKLNQILDSLKTSASVVYNTLMAIATFVRISHGP